MLTLTRKPGESFRIGENIVVKIQGVRGQSVRVSIHAPNLEIVRAEIDSTSLEALPK